MQNRAKALEYATNKFGDLETLWKFSKIRESRQRKILGYLKGMKQNEVWAYDPQQDRVSKSFHNVGKQLKRLRAIETRYDPLVKDIVRMLKLEEITISIPIKDHDINLNGSAYFAINNEYSTPHLDVLLDGTRYHMWGGEKHSKDIYDRFPPSLLMESFIEWAEKKFGIGYAAMVGEDGS